MVKRSRYVAISGLALIIAGLVPVLPEQQQAEAQILPGPPPCPTMITPPPCITFDYRRLGEWATRNAQTMQQIQATVGQVTQIRDTVQTVGTQIQNVSNLGGMQVIDLIGGSGGGNNGRINIAGLGDLGRAEDVVEQNLFAGAGVTRDEGAASMSVRNAALQDANATAYAAAMVDQAVLSENQFNMCRLQKRSERSPDIRTDWAINSEVKRELTRVLAEQNGLWATFLQQQAASAATQLPSAMDPAEYQASATTAPRPTGNQNAHWGSVNQLRQLAAEAQRLIGALGVVAGVNQVREMLGGVVNDAEETARRRDNVLNQFRTAASRWSSSGPTIVNTALSRMGQIDEQLASLRSQPVESLAAAFRERNIDAAAIQASGLDPRQFIGTWADPLKAQNARNAANELVRGPLDRYLDGDDENDAFRQMFLDFYDVRLEEAWKRELANQARTSLEEVAGVARQAEEHAGRPLAGDEVTQRLQAIVTQANQLGSSVSNGGDPAAVAAARAALEELQRAVNGPTGLPAVEQAPPIDPNEPTPTP